MIGNEYDDSGIDLNGLEIDEIRDALSNKDSEESQEILAKYDPKVIEFVEKTGEGDYILMPNKDENGNQNNFKCTTSNYSE